MNLIMINLIINLLINLKIKVKNLGKKLLKKNKKSRIYVDKRIYKTAWYNVPKLISNKNEFFERKLKQCIGKPKDLLKALK